RVGIALEEALTNAMCHGNLEVSSALRLRDDDAYARLIRERCGQPPYRDRRGCVRVRAAGRGGGDVFPAGGAGVEPAGPPGPPGPPRPPQTGRERGGGAPCGPDLLGRKYPTPGREPRPPWTTAAGRPPARRGRGRGAGSCPRRRSDLAAPQRREYLHGFLAS